MCAESSPFAQNTVKLSVWQAVWVRVPESHFTSVLPGRFFLKGRSQNETRDWFVYEFCTLFFVTVRHNRQQLANQSRNKKGAKVKDRNNFSQGQALGLTLQKVISVFCFWSLRNKKNTASPYLTKVYFWNCSLWLTTDRFTSYVRRELAKANNILARAMQNHPSRRTSVKLKAING